MDADVKCTKVKRIQLTVRFYGDEKGKIRNYRNNEQVDGIVKEVKRQ